MFQRLKIYIIQGIHGHLHESMTRCLAVFEATRCNGRLRALDAIPVELYSCQQASLGGRLRRYITFAVLQLAERPQAFCEARTLLMPVQFLTG